MEAPSRWPARARGTPGYLFLAGGNWSCRLPKLNHPGLAAEAGRRLAYPLQERGFADPTGTDLKLSDLTRQRALLAWQHDEMAESVSDTPEAWAQEASVVARTESPVTRAGIVAALRAAGVPHGGVIIVHSSLSRLGWVVGGAHTAVLALRDAVGSTGTIVMPALSSNLSEPSGWVAPPVPEAWWQIVRDEVPAYDARLTPMTAMGAVAECFRHLPGTVRGAHPADSFMANGPLADDVIAPHPLESGFGAGSPLDRLYDHQARIVLLGVGHSNNTSLHLAESRTRWAADHRITYGAPLMVDGQRRWVTYDDVDYDNDDFAAAGAAFAAATGSEVRASLGAGEVIACDMHEIVDFATDWLDYNRGTRV